jgi:hypothetical protein
LVAKPVSSSRNAAMPVGPVIPASAIRANVVLWALLANRAKPVARVRKLRWVITEYQAAAGRTAGRSAWSERTSTVDATAIVSQPRRNETTSPADGTMSMPSRKSANADHPVREAAGPCA